ncbi:MAG TPA: TldD/PmbA family protein [Methanobacteriaceae archaeon]|nr:TldD/PmbA family protein [Methanobacteriaceae archaeon]
MIEEVAYEALNKAFKVSEEVEVYVGTEEGLDIDIQKDRVGFAKEVYSLGVGVRVILDDRMGFAYTTNLKLIDKTVKKAEANALANQPDENFTFAQKSKYFDVKGLYDHRAESMDVDSVVEFGKLLISTAQDEGCQPTSGGYSVGYEKNILLNSNDVECKNASTLFSGFLSVNAPDGEVVSTAHESNSSCKMELDPEKIAKKACNVALQSRGGQPTSTGDTTVILGHHAVAGLLSTFTQAINGDNVQRGRSIYAGKEKENVASLDLSIYDDGTVTGGLNSSQGDGEGTPSQKTTLIKDGVLKNFIYDIYTAQKGKIKSTGNGMRVSYADMPSVGLSNLVVKFENYHEWDEVRKGVMVTDVLGAHTANPISGDFSVEVMNAFHIEDGEISQPVKKAMLSGNIFEILKDVKGLSGEKRQLGPFIIPQLLCSSLRIVG